MRSENLCLNKIKKETVVKQTTVFYGKTESTDQLVFLPFIVRKIFLSSLTLRKFPHFPLDRFN